MLQPKYYDGCCSEGGYTRVLISIPKDETCYVAWPRSERAAMNLAIEYAHGRSYRIEFFDDHAIFSTEEPYKILEQAALPFENCTEEAL
jgi:hypothetical protein